MVAKDETRQRSTSITETSCAESIESAFPCKIHVVLAESERQGFENVISWQGDRAFTIRDPKKFEESVMKEYFNQHNYKSFQRQLQIHGFERVVVGDAVSATYTHQLLVRGKPNMCRFVVRAKSKKKTRRRSSSPAITKMCAEIPSTSLASRRSLGRTRRIPSAIFRNSNSNSSILSHIAPDSNHPEFRSLNSNQNFLWTTNKVENAALSNPVEVDSRGPITSSNQFPRFDIPHVSLGRGADWLTSPFTGTELASPFAKHSTSNHNHKHKHNRSHSSPSALTTSLFSPAIETGTHRLDRDRREESLTGGQRFRHMIWTLEASLSVLHLATHRQPDR